MSTARLAFIGEALIDLGAMPAAGALAFQGREGGALANSAIAAARLGQPTAFVGQLSTDFFGDRLQAHLQDNGVDMQAVSRDNAPTALAFVERQGTVNRYAFYFEGTAGTRWSPQGMPVLPESCRCLYFGSIALLFEPAATHIMALVRAERGRRVVVFDPNVRPSVIRDLPAFRLLAAQCLRLCDLVKLSDEDASVLFPNLPMAQVAGLCLAQGASAVVVTRGAQGATLYRCDRLPMHVTPPAVALRDTVGAGDTFGAALSVALLEAGVEQPGQLAGVSDATWAAVLRFAAMAAALNCTRDGADPPRRGELDAALALTPPTVASDTLGEATRCEQIAPPS